MRDVRDYDRYWRERAGPRAAARSRTRARLAARLIGRPGARILDVGCGPGYAAEELARLGYHVYGVDVSPEAVGEARIRGITARVLDVERDGVPRGFDAIVCLEVLEHLGDPERVLDEILEALEGDAVAVISLPNEFHILNRLGILAGRPGFGGHDDPHLRHFGWRSARRFLRDAGAAVEAWRPDSIVPPRLGPLAGIGAAVARVLPGLFALSVSFRIRRATS